MTLSQIRSLVKRATGSDVANMPDFSINQLINLAQKEVVRQTLCLNKNAAVTTVAAQEQYSLPSDFHKSTQMKVGSVFLEYKLETYIDRLYTTTPDTGSPYYYYIDREADKYGLYPIPSGVETGKFAYRAMPTAMTADADVPDISEMYHDLIVVGATYRVFEQLNKTDLYINYFSMFKVMLADMANDLGIRQADDTPRMMTSQDILDA